MSIDPVDRAAHARALPPIGQARGGLTMGADSAMSGADAPAVALVSMNVVGPLAAMTAADAPAAAQVRLAIADAQRQLAGKASELTFEFDEGAQRVIVRLIDTRTGEVLRQIPPEEALAIARALRDDTAIGLLLRAQA